MSRIDGHIRFDSLPSSADEYAPSIKSIKSKMSINTDNVNVEIVDYTSGNVKFSLAHYFPGVFAVFMLILLIATIILFVWSNTSNGVWVSLQLKPVLPPNTNLNHTNDLLFPFATSVLSVNNINMHNINNSDAIRLLINDIQNIYYDPTNTLSSLRINQNELLPKINNFALNVNTFHFSLVSSVSDMWQSKAYGLAILIAVFSGIWPYIKLLLLIICWLIPLKQKHRQRILIFLDQIGKFSLIDLFFSLYMIILFYADVVKTYKGVGIELKVVVEPDVGLNTFVIGTAISMIFSHMFLYLDRKYATLTYNNDCKNEYDNTNNQPLCLRFIPSSYIAIFTRSFMFLLIVCSIWSVIDSVFTAPARYNITGLLGWAVNNPIRAYTPWQIVTQVRSHTDQHVAAIPLSFTVFLTIIFFPLSLLLFLTIIWFMPIRFKYINYLNILMQTCMAWTALDVFAVASIAATLELDKISQWILNENHAKICGPNGIIPKVVHGLQCFAVEGHIIWGTYLLVFASVSTWIVSIYTIYSFNQAKTYWKKMVK